MGANVTLPPRRRLTNIPAIAGRMLATPCAWGRIRVTVDLAITDKNRATPVPSMGSDKNHGLERAPRRIGGDRLTRSVSK
jgi:hypothetical protein